MRPLAASCRWLVIFSAALGLLVIAPAGRAGHFGKPMRLCRSVAQTVSIAGEQVQATGMICRRSDGRWSFSG